MCKLSWGGCMKLRVYDVLSYIFNKEMLIRLEFSVAIEKYFYKKDRLPNVLLP